MIVIKERICSVYTHKELIFISSLQIVILYLFDFVRNKIIVNKEKANSKQIVE